MTLILASYLPFLFGRYKRRQSNDESSDDTGQEALPAPPSRPRQLSVLTACFALLLLAALSVWTLSTPRLAGLRRAQGGQRRVLTSLSAPVQLSQGTNITTLRLSPSSPLAAWTSRSEPFVNVFLVWTTNRDSWGVQQDRVLGSVASKIKGARVRVLSNSLPLGHFAGLVAEGYDVSVLPYDLQGLLRGIPGQKWLEAVLQGNSPHKATHIADMLRLLVLYRFGGLYLDTDALWLRDIADLPEAFIGEIDFLRLEPSCEWCVEKRWYLANGVLSFPQQHPFLKYLLEAIDNTLYEPDVRTAIGPRFLTTAFLSSAQQVVSDIVLLEEFFFYPIAGPDVPQYFLPSPEANGLALKIRKESYSVHLFAYTFSRLEIHPESVYGQLLRLDWPPARGALCPCSLMDPHSPLCAPSSIIIPYVKPSSGWFWPSARICLKINPAAILWGESVTLTVSAKHGVIHTWTTPSKRSLTLHLYGPLWTSDELNSLEYRHVGDHCNDVVTVQLRFFGIGSLLRIFTPTFTTSIAVSAPCYESSIIPEAHLLRTPFPSDWKYLVVPEVPSVTLQELQADPIRLADFTRCLRLGSVGKLQLSATGDQMSSRRLRVGLLVSATGTYTSWLDGFILSAEAYFMRSAEVHYFVLTDRMALDFEPKERIHLLYQPLLGWPYDSMFRHQLYLKFRAHFAGMDYLMVVDVDVAFLSDVGEELLGETMGVLQSFSFGQDCSKAPFETDRVSTSYIPSGQGSCYYAGGIFGGTYAGLVRLLQRTTLLMEWDLAYANKTAEHDDESYINKVFFLYPPSVSLGGNYIFPEPPADHIWGLRGVNWQEVFVPVISNLGARKTFSASLATDRTSYKNPFSAEAALRLLSSTDSPPSRKLVSVGVCIRHSGSQQDKMDFIQALVDSVAKWYSTEVEIIVVDTDPESGNEVHELERNLLLLKGKVSFFAVPDDDSDGSSAGCTLPALRLLLQAVTSPSVFLLDAIAVLTWQSYIPFLHEQLLRLNEQPGSRSIVATCRRTVTAPVGLESPTFNFTALCDFPSFADLSREHDATPAVALQTPMRSLECWEEQHVAGHIAVLVNLELARALADSAQPGACQGIGCWLDAGLAHQSSSLMGQPSQQILSCLQGLQPIIFPISAKDIENQ